jgi:hypothetical protein
MKLRLRRRLALDGWSFVQEVGANGQRLTFWQRHHERLVRIGRHWFVKHPAKPGIGCVLSPLPLDGPKLEYASEDALRADGFVRAYGDPTGSGASR